MSELWEHIELQPLNATYLAYLLCLDESVVAADCLPKCLSSLVVEYADDFFFKALRRAAFSCGGIIRSSDMPYSLQLDTRNLDRMRFSFVDRHTRNVIHPCIVSWNEVWVAMQTDMLQHVVMQKLTPAMKKGLGLSFMMEVDDISRKILRKAREINDELCLGVVWLGK
jgi:hypothetical protein